MSPEDRKRKKKEYDKKRLERIVSNPELRKRKNEINKRYYHENKSVNRRWNLSKYGITQEDFDRMIEEQGNCCAICSRYFSETPNIDHDHSTGKVRALLCFHCNTGLGKFGDSEEMLERALNYIRRFKN